MLWCSNLDIVIMCIGTFSHVIWWGIFGAITGTESLCVVKGYINLQYELLVKDFYKEFRFTILFINRTEITRHPLDTYFGVTFSIYNSIKSRYAACTHFCSTYIFWAENSNYDSMYTKQSGSLKMGFSYIVVP